MQSILLDILLSRIITVLLKKYCSSLFQLQRNETALVLRTLKFNLVVTSEKHSWEDCLISIMTTSVSRLMIEAVSIRGTLEEVKTLYKVNLKSQNQQIDLLLQCLKWLNKPLSKWKKKTSVISPSYVIKHPTFPASSPTQLCVILQFSAILNKVFHIKKSDLHKKK